MDTAAGENLGGGGESTGEGGRVIPTIGVRGIDMEPAGRMAIPLASEPESGSTPRTGGDGFKKGIHPVNIWTAKYDGE